MWAAPMLQKSGTVNAPKEKRLMRLNKSGQEKEWPEMDSFLVEQKLGFALARLCPMPWRERFADGSRGDGEPQALGPRS